jgi:hypothetical protein
MLALVCKAERAVLDGSVSLKPEHAQIIPGRLANRNADSDSHTHPQ